MLQQCPACEGTEGAQVDSSDSEANICTDEIKSRLTQFGQEKLQELLDCTIRKLKHPIDRVGRSCDQELPFSYLLNAVRV